MKIIYGPTADVIYLELNQSIPIKTKRITDQIVFDFDADGKLTALNS